MAACGGGRIKPARQLAMARQSQGHLDQWGHWSLQLQTHIQHAPRQSQWAQAEVPEQVQPRGPVQALSPELAGASVR